MENLEYLAQVVNDIKNTPEYARRLGETFKMSSIYHDSPEMLMNAIIDVNKLADTVKSKRGDKDATYLHLHGIASNLRYVLNFIWDVEKVFIENKSLHVNYEVLKERVNAQARELIIFDAIESALKSGNIDEVITTVKAKIELLK